jgi:hypothetical protein
VAVNTLRPPRPAPTPDADEQAVERYRYLLRTAPPDQIERAHAEAFERLTPEQRAIVRSDLQATAGPGDAPLSDDPRDLARAATRTEMRAPGTLERSFSSGPAAPGMAGSFLQTFAAVFIATSVAQALFGGYGDPGTTADGTADPSTETGDAGAADAGDVGGATEVGGLGDAGGFGGDGGFGDFGGFDF